MEETAGFYRHGLRRMQGRRVDEQHRASTPLELLFDLTFVVAFGVAGSELAHGIAAGHWPAAVGGFAFAMGAIIWAWINFSWLASAFDTDDWLFRALTMVQMTGVIILAIGLPAMFASIEHGDPIDNRVMVAGYVVMRLALVAQWLRIARSDPQHRTVALTYAFFVSVAQIGWVAIAVVQIDTTWAYVGAALLWILELGGPVLAERKGVRHGGGMTPWHPHHIAERYGLLTIIALGETVLGTLSAAQAISAAEGWTIATIVVIAAGVALTFTLWWSYFLLPSGPMLAARRDRGFPWGYGHFFVFGSIAAVGAGLHLIGYVYDEHSHVSNLMVIAAIAVPVMVYLVALYVIHAWLVSSPPRTGASHLVAMIAPAVAIVLSANYWPLWACLVIVVVAPLTTIVSVEVGGWRKASVQLERALGKADA